MGTCRIRALAGKVVLKTVLVLVAILFLSPFYISFVYSVKSRQEITLTGLAFPTVFHFENYSRAIVESNFGHAFLNSLATTLPCVVILIFTCCMASYVFARNSGKFYAVLYTIFLASLFIPFQCIMLPEYVNLKQMNLLNTFTGNVLVKSALLISYNVLIYTGFVKTVPKELEEAANIDGAGPFSTFWLIVFPLLKPITFSALIIDTLQTWNDFGIAIVTLQKDELHTLPLMLYNFFGEHNVELNLAFATFMLTMIPMIVLYLCLQKYITSGLTAGAVKG